MIAELVDAAIAAILGRKAPPKRYRRKVSSAYEARGRGEFAGQKMVDVVREHAILCRGRGCYQPVLPKPDTAASFSGEDVWPGTPEMLELDLHTGDIFEYVPDQRKRR